MEFNQEIKPEVKPEEKSVKTLPVYEDIKGVFQEANYKTKNLLTELIIRRALTADKTLKKNLGITMGNKQVNGKTIFLIGLYYKTQLSEREADELLLSDNVDIKKMWVIDKYSDLAKEFI